MFLTKNDELVFKAFILCKANHQAIIQRYMSIIKNVFNHFIIRRDFTRILEMITSIPSLKENRMNIILYDVLFSCNYFNEKMIKLINLLTPERKVNYLNIEPISNDENPPIPSILIDSNPMFWNFYYSNRTKINKIIEDNQLTLFNDNYNIGGDNSMISLKLFDEYPELFSFSFKYYKLFYNKIKTKINKEATFDLFVDRENLLESSFHQLHLLSSDELKKKPKINYIGERGYDLGGLRRDWLTLLSRKIFNVDLGLFSLCDNMTYQPNIESYSNPNYLELFKIAGIFIEKAILLGEHIDGHLSHSLLCNILGRKVGLEDLKETDEFQYNSLLFYLNNDLNEYETLETYFEVTQNNFGQTRTYELIENGSQVRVTNENKLQYVELMVKYLLINSIECQIQKFLEGFYSLIPLNYISIFTPNQLDLLITGISRIDVDEMRNYTIYKCPYTCDSPTVVLFFDSIKKWNQSDLEKLLYFITGSPKVPANGFKHYKDIGIPIIIQVGGGNDMYPQAHTCINSLALPSYENEEQLNIMFKTAFDNSNFYLE